MPKYKVIRNTDFIMDGIIYRNNGEYVELPKKVEHRDLTPWVEPKAPAKVEPKAPAKGKAKNDNAS